MTAEILAATEHRARLGRERSCRQAHPLGTTAPPAGSGPSRGSPRTSGRRRAAGELAARARGGRPSAALPTVTPRAQGRRAVAALPQGAGAKASSSTCPRKCSASSRELAPSETSRPAA
jgi:hypothetical protein